MGDYEIGYRRPPKHTQFKNGNNANPKGRPTNKPEMVIAIIHEMSNGTTQYTERGRTKKAPWAELTLKKTIALALGGNLRSIEALLKRLIYAQRIGDSGTRRIRVRNFLPDFPGQTGAEKTQQFSERDHVDDAEVWKRQDAGDADETA